MWAIKYIPDQKEVPLIIANLKSESILCEIVETKNLKFIWVLSWIETE